MSKRLQAILIAIILAIQASFLLISSLKEEGKTSSAPAPSNPPELFTQK